MTVRRGKLPGFRRNVLEAAKEAIMRSPTMSSRFLIGAALLGAVLTGGASGSAAPARQSAVFYLTEPTLIGSTIVHGPVVFTHDDRKMARGEPCTTVYLFEPRRNAAADEVASFHCIPKARQVVSTFTVKTTPNTALGFGCILTEYQFAGDSEGHGVPPMVVYVN
jgi:hypothetical protein